MACIFCLTEPDTPRSHSELRTTSGHFDFWRNAMNNKKEHQPPLTIEYQIENLKKIGLIIEDECKAHDFLNDISYFRFIKAFSLGLKDKNATYRDRVSFNTLQELYLFNSNFRHVLFPQIEKIEVNLRCRLGNYFCMKYDVLGYLNEKNFVDSGRHSDFLNDIKKEIALNRKSPFVKNFKENYIDGHLPLYALLEIMTFGTLSKFFQNLKTEDRKIFCRTYYKIPYTYFESWIENIAYVRNICAHYGRLYNAKLTKSPTLFEEYKNKKIHNYYIYSTILCMKHLLHNDRHWLEFVNDLNLLFCKYNHVKKELLGFPQDWKELLLN